MSASPVQQPELKTSSQPFPLFPPSPASALSLARASRADATRAWARAVAAALQPFPADSPSATLSHRQARAQLRYWAGRMAFWQARVEWLEEYLR